MATTTTNVEQLKINVMTQQQYNTATKSATELYLVTDAKVDYATDVTNKPTIPSTAADVGAVAKTGDTMSGNLGFGSANKIEFQGSGSYKQSIQSESSTSLKFGSTYGTSYNIIMDLGRTEIRPVTNNYGYIGSTNYYWGEGYIKTLNSTDVKCTTLTATYLTNNNIGNNLTVPNVAGKVAAQVTSLPTAAVAEEGNIYQFVGTTTSSYINGYFYKCVSDGATPTPTYSWEAVNVQEGGSSLPSQTGNSGKFLTTDGTDASWAPALVNNTTSTYSLSIEGSITSSASDASDLAIKGSIGSNAQYSIAIGTGSSCNSHYSVALGANSYADYYATAIGRSASASDTNAVALGNGARASGQNSIQLGSGYRTNAYNSTANTFKVANANGNYEMMSADGTIPADRLKNAINKYSTMPTAASTNEGWIVQYIGTTDSTYTHGHLYECISDGGVTPVYSWSEVQLGGGSSLPSMTGNSGKYLTNDGTDASWSAVVTFRVWGGNE